MQTKTEIKESLQSVIDGANELGLGELATALQITTNRFSAVLGGAVQNKKVVQQELKPSTLNNVWNPHGGVVEAKKKVVAEIPQALQVDPPAPVDEAIGEKDDDSVDMASATDEELMKHFGSLKAAKKYAKNEMGLNFPGNISRSKLFILIRENA